MITFIANVFEACFSMFVLGIFIGIIVLAFTISAASGQPLIIAGIIIGGFFLEIVIFGLIASLLDIRKSNREILALLQSSVEG